MTDVLSYRDILFTRQKNIETQTHIAMPQKVQSETTLGMRISGAGGYFAAPGSHPPKAGAFAPRKTVAQPSIVFCVYSQYILHS